MLRLKTHMPTLASILSPFTPIRVATGSFGLERRPSIDGLHAADALFSAARERRERSETRTNRSASTRNTVAILNSAITRLACA
jgi:hypothetical protein